jgi:hypothetical protein
MGSLKNFLPGVKTKIYWGNLAQVQLVQANLTGILVPPPDVSVTLSAAVALADGTIAVTALSGPIAAGTALSFTSGTDKFVVYTTADTLTAATSIAIRPSQVAIASGAVCAHRGLIQLKGGTNSQEQIQNTSQDIQVYQDSTGLGYKDGIITDAMWQVSYDFKVLPDDLGYYRLKYTAKTAVGGSRGYVRKIDPAPPGFLTGETIEGLADITDWSIDNPSDNIVAGKCTFKGRGEPITIPPSLV